MIRLRYLVIGLAFLLLGQFFVLNQSMAVSGSILDESDTPDLTITNVALTPSSPEVGQTVTVNVSVKNLGSSLTSGQGIDNWFSSIQDFTWASTSVPLMGAREVSSSTPMVTNEVIVYTGSGSFSSAGTKSVTLKVDNANELTEEVETNNSWTVPIVVAPVAPVIDKPDLTITGVSFNPASPRVDENVVIKVNVKNLGTSLTSGQGIDNWLTAVEDFTWSSSSLPLLGARQVTSSSPMVMNETIIYSGSGHFNATGTKDVNFKVDNANELTEMDETNNTWIGTLTVISSASDDDDDDDEEDDDNDNEGHKVLVCHFNNGTKQYSEILVDRNGWLHGHAKQGDFIKTGDTCAISGGNSTSTTATTTPVVARLRERIRSLDYQASEMEHNVVAWEKQLVKRINKALTERLRGRILLQVQNSGEAWYLDPDSQQRFYLQNGNSAYQALQAFGLGITDQNLQQIPIGLVDKFAGEDTDGDGLPDKLEISIGTDPNNPDSDGDGYNDKEEIMNNYSPLGPNKMAVNTALTNRLKGKILLQVQKQGQAWWINPEDGKRYYLKDGQTAYDIMRYLSLGITNEDIEQIDVGSLE